MQLIFSGMKRRCRRLLLLKRLRDAERGDKMKVIWESDLQIEKMLDAVAKGIGDLLLGALIFGGMTVALYI